MKGQNSNGQILICGQTTGVLGTDGITPPPFFVIILFTNPPAVFTRSFLFCLSNWVVQTHQQYFTRSFLFCLSNWVVQTQQQ
jgi:hypothetical protein